MTANGYFSLGRTDIDANNYFTVGATAADVLMVDTSNASIAGASNRDLLELTIQNATNSKTITIARMIVTWDNSRKLQQVRIRESRRWYNATVGANR